LLNFGQQRTKTDSKGHKKGGPVHGCRPFCGLLRFYSAS
jgi:hypothetical protein